MIIDVHIGEYAIGETIRVSKVEGLYNLKALKYKTNEVVDEVDELSIDKLWLVLEEWTSGYYTDKILEIAEKL